MKPAWKPFLDHDPRSDLLEDKSARTFDLGPRPHGVYSDRDRRGNARISVTLPRKGRRGGKRLRTLTGHPRNIVYPYLSRILFDHTGRHFSFDAKGLTNEYHTISEDAAVQMLLLMDAVRLEPKYKKAVSLGRGHCRNEPLRSRVVVRAPLQPEQIVAACLQALALMHALKSINRM